MLTLSRTGIRNLASSDVVYSRGLQYYKAGRGQYSKLPFTFIRYW